MAKLHVYWALVACCAISPLHAQEITGSISGEVRDSGGAVMPGVRVTVLNTATNVTNAVLTGPSGTYRVPFLIFGRYTVSAELQGFKITRAENVQVSTSEEARVDLTLSVGEVNETVTLSARKAVLKTEEATVGTTVDERMVTGLPLVGRQIIAATLLAPGAYFVNNNSKAQRDSGFVRRNGVSLSVNGLTDLSNKFYYDGIEGMNFDGGTRAFDPVAGSRAGSEGAGELQLGRVRRAPRERRSTSSPSRARTSSTATATTTCRTTCSTRSKWTRRTCAPGRSAPTNSSPRTSRWCATTCSAAGVGGPISKDKLFFFANYEGNPRHACRTVRPAHHSHRQDAQRRLHRAAHSAAARASRTPATRRLTATASSPTRRTCAGS